MSLDGCQNLYHETDLYAMRLVSLGQWKRGVVSVWQDLEASTTARTREFSICWRRVTWC